MHSRNKNKPSFCNYKNAKLQPQIMYEISEVVLVPDVEIKLNLFISYNCSEKMSIIRTHETQNVRPFRYLLSVIRWYFYFAKFISDDCFRRSFEKRTCLTSFCYNAWIIYVMRLRRRIAILSPSK